METFQILLRTKGRISRDQAEDALHGYLAALLEKNTRKPVYYYLMKHFGVSDEQERRRRCPACKKAWALAAPQHDIFDFRCDRCRLLSNVAFDVRLSV